MPLLPSIPFSLHLTSTSSHHSYRSGAVSKPRSNAMLVATGQDHWSDAEDQFWRWQYSQEPYFVPGRSYEQYRPAYILGRNFAWMFSAENFLALRNDMACEWDMARGQSHLPWREVEPAAQAAWQRAGMYQSDAAPIYSLKELGQDNLRVLQNLAETCMTLVQDIERMQSVPMDDFLEQVLARHALMLRRFVQGLAQHGVKVTHAQPDFIRQWRLKLAQLAEKWSEPQVKDSLENFALREEALGALYSRTLRANLPLEILGLLKQQAHVLKRNREKLIWVKNHWEL